MSPRPRATGRLPWHGRQWRWLDEAYARGRLPHALLLHGPPGTGKLELAAWLARSLMCQAPSRREDGVPPPCGACRGCRLLDAGAHPDQTVLEPEPDKQNIGIEQIRDLIRYLGLTTHYAPLKVVRIQPGESLTRPAADTLLKTLEEPPGPALIVLTARAPALLPATVRSRCQSLAFPPPPVPEGVAWLASRTGDAQRAGELLAMSRGSPLRALELDTQGGEPGRVQLIAELGDLVGGADPLAIAAAWRTRGPALTIGLLQEQLCEIIRIRSGAGTSGAGSEAMQAVGQRLDLIEAFGLLDRCAECRRAAEGRTSWNPQLMLEDLAIRIARAGHRGRAGVVV